MWASRASPSRGVVAPCWMAVKSSSRDSGLMGNGLRLSPKNIEDVVDDASSGRRLIFLGRAGRGRFAIEEDLLLGREVVAFAAAKKAASHADDFQAVGDHKIGHGVGILDLLHHGGPDRQGDGGGVASRHDL